MADESLQVVEVALPPEAISYLSEQASERGLTPTQVLVSALGTDKYVRDKAAASDSDVIVMENGKSVKLSFPSGAR